MGPVSESPSLGWSTQQTPDEAFHGKLVIMRMVRAQLSSHIEFTSVEANVFSSICGVESLIHYDEALAKIKL